MERSNAWMRILYDLMVRERIYMRAAVQIVPIMDTDGEYVSDTSGLAGEGWGGGRVRCGDVLQRGKFKKSNRQQSNRKTNRNPS